MKTPHPQRGATLIEALVAMLLLSLSLVAATRLQGTLRLNGDLARERSEALRHAQQDLERLRSFENLAVFDQGGAVRNEIQTRTSTLHLQRGVTEHAGFKTLHDTVRWHPRGAGAQEVQLVTGLARLAPVYSAALALPPQNGTLAVRRHLPFGARTLPDGRSIVRPTRSSRIAWVVDGATGDILQQCQVAAADTTRAHLLAASDLTHCEPFVARLIRGYLRFALSPSPDPLHANDPPLPLALHAGGARCETETIHHDGERYIAYACALTNTDHDVVLEVTPHGWALGTAADTYRVCRYPAAGRAPRNYLVIRGSIECPSALPPHNGAPVVTVQHQP